MSLCLRYERKHVMCPSYVTNFGLILIVTFKLSNMCLTHFASLSCASLKSPVAFSIHQMNLSGFVPQ